jgi:uncharacterized protein YlaN (UPF0358 family)
MSDELIKLQSANMHQVTVKDQKQDWLIRQNMTNVVLDTFPANMTDEQMFKIMDFARKFELEAFNAGIQFAKKNLMENKPMAYNPNLRLIKEG